MSDQKKPVAVSHGRGGQGNIGAPGDVQYVDGEILRQEDPTETGAAYSTGRGGGGNIGAAKIGAALTPVPTRPESEVNVVPEVAKVPIHEGEYYHSGRGGQGNAFIPAEEAKKAAEEAKTGKTEEKKEKSTKSLADRIKHRLSRILGGGK